MPDAVPAVCLDTSFLITLCDSSRKGHEAAKKYFQHWVEHGVQLIVSTVVLAEYQVRATLDDEVLKYVLVVPFDAETATYSAQFMAKKLSEQGAGTTESSRDQIKDDFKILAAACQYHAKAIATQDSNSLARYVQFIRERFPIANGLSVIDPSDGFNEGLADFGQLSLPLPGC